MLCNLKNRSNEVEARSGGEREDVVDAREDIAPAIPVQ